MYFLSFHCLKFCYIRKKGKHCSGYLASGTNCVALSLFSVTELWQPLVWTTKYFMFQVHGRFIVLFLPFLLVVLSLILASELWTETCLSLPRIIYLVANSIPSSSLSPSTRLVCNIPRGGALTAWIMKNRHMVHKILTCSLSSPIQKLVNYMALAFS